jgi:hypothetical protein
MRRTLDHAVQTILAPLEGLRAVVLSVAPDGLIAWCWSRDDKPEIALGFAALDRAATVCLEGIGASHRSRNLLLSAEDAWIVSWPLYDDDEPISGRERLVLTTVFSGNLRNGMVMVYGTRVRAHIRMAVDAARSQSCKQLRERLVDLVLNSPDASVALQDLANAAKIDLDQLDRLDQLGVDAQRRLLALLEPAPQRLVLERASPHAGSEA